MYQTQQSNKQSEDIVLLMVNIGFSRCAVIIQRHKYFFCENCVSFKPRRFHSKSSPSPTY